MITRIVISTVVFLAASLGQHSIRLEAGTEHVPTRSSTIIENQRVEPFDLTGSWQLAWDDEMDGELGMDGTKWDVRFEKSDDQFTGRVERNEDEGVRNSEWKAEAFGDSTPLLSLVQKHRDYTRVYQIYWAPSKDGAPLGVWHDTHGDSGNFTLLKYQ